MTSSRFARGAVKESWAQSLFTRVGSRPTFDQTDGTTLPRHAYTCQCRLPCPGTVFPLLDWVYLKSAD